MSGEYLGGAESNLAYSVFKYAFQLDYGEDGRKQSKNAAKMNPMEDSQISEIVWDVFVLLRSWNYYQSGDIGEKQYRDDVKWFKDKWFKRTKRDIDVDTISILLTKAYEEILTTIYPDGGTK